MPAAGAVGDAPAMAEDPPVRRNVYGKWNPKLEWEYGLEPVGGADGAAGEVPLKATCKFCVTFGREPATAAPREAAAAAAADGKAGEPGEAPPAKRRRGKRRTAHTTGNFNVSHVKTHLSMEHPAAWARYCELRAAPSFSREASAAFFAAGGTAGAPTAGADGAASQPPRGSAAGDGDAGSVGGGGGGEEDAATAACLAALQTRGVSAAVVGKLDEEELAAVLAAFMVGYSGKRAHKFAALRRCLTAVFQGDDIAGDTLIGDSAVPEDAFSTAVVDGLNGDPACRATLGYRSRLATFLQLLRAPPPAPH
jgi:hypothetical protein